MYITAKVNHDITMHTLLQEKFKVTNEDRDTQNANCPWLKKKKHIIFVFKKKANLEKYF